MQSTSILISQIEMLEKLQVQLEYFLNAVNFNSDLSKWNISSVISMELMFSGANSVNEDL
jgi:surface protein